MRLSDIKEGMELRIAPMTRDEYSVAVVRGMYAGGYVDTMGREDYVIEIVDVGENSVVASDGYYYAPEQLEPLIQEYEVL